MINLIKIPAVVLMGLLWIIKQLLSGFLSFANWLDRKVDNLIERL